MAFIVIFLGLTFSLNSQSKTIGSKHLDHKDMGSDRSYDQIGDQSFEAVASIRGCSGSIIKFDFHEEDHPAIFMTNDHCIDDQPDQEYTVDKVKQISVSVYDKNRKIIKGKLKTTRIIYAVQTGTDLALLELNLSYSELRDLYKIEPFEILSKGAAVGEKISILSGYWNRQYNCSVENIAFQLRESTWLWRQSYGYSCGTTGGTSGSPIVLTGTRYVIGINNTANESGGECTLGNPCEITREGELNVYEGKNYGQQTQYLSTCFGASGNFDIDLKGCQMFGGDSWLRPNL